MVTAAVSGDVSVAEELLSYFVDIGNKDCFAATLYVCFDLVRPDVVAEMVSSISSLPLLRLTNTCFSVMATRLE